MTPLSDTSRLVGFLWPSLAAFPRSRKASDRFHAGKEPLSATSRREPTLIFAFPKPIVRDTLPSDLAEWVIRLGNVGSGLLQHTLYSVSAPRWHLPSMRNMDYAPTRSCCSTPRSSSSCS